MQFPFGFWKPSSSADLLSGANGSLSLNATTATINAGDIKRYSSISLTNSAILYVLGYNTYGAANPGHLPTIIGCAGNCTIDATSQITAAGTNAGLAADFYGDTEYSAATIPFDAALNPISYYRMGGYGGYGGETGGFTTLPGNDLTYGASGAPTGHGGGGSGYVDGGNTTDDQPWGTSGYGADSIASGSPTPYAYPAANGFGGEGSPGAGGETGTGISVGGGGAGGLRGLSGGAIFLQVAGTANITGTIDVSGTNGGPGGGGGLADTSDSEAYGGGGGGGGAGGSGGYVWIYYKTGTVTPTINANGGTGGHGGAEGIAYGPFAVNGYAGSAGVDGLAGGSIIAAY